MTFAEVLQALSKLFRWWVCVAPWQGGLRVRVGRRVTLLTPGIWFVIPYLDAIYVQSLRQRFETMPTQTVTTKDGRAVTVGAMLGYSIRDIRRTYDTLEHASGTIIAMAGGALADQIARLTVTELSLTGVGVSTTQALEFDKYGFADVSVVVTDLVVTRTLRLIYDQRWSHGENLNTNAVAAGT